MYDAHQHLTLLALRQLEGKSYRRFAEWLRDCKPLLRLLKLGRIPHYTTLQKFAARISASLLDRVLRSFIPEGAAAFTSTVLGVDASGFKPSKASSYYTRSLKPRLGL
ncbi:MAG: transposase [Candidatus Bathyarchaeia archaeon]